LNFYSVADPDPRSGIRCPFDRWIQDGMNKPDNISESSETFFRVKMIKFFDSDPVSGIKDGKDSDSGWKKLGFGINIPDTLQ
jgi:hypothetical protein